MTAVVGTLSLSDQEALFRFFVEGTQVTKYLTQATWLVRTRSMARGNLTISPEAKKKKNLPCNERNRVTTNENKQYLHPHAYRFLFVTSHSPMRYEARSQMRWQCAELVKDLLRNGNVQNLDTDQFLNTRILRGLVLSQDPTDTILGKTTDLRHSSTKDRIPHLRQ